MSRQSLHPNPAILNGERKPAPLPAGRRVALMEGQVPSIRVKRIGQLSDRAVGEALGLAGAVGALPVEIRHVVAA